MINPSQAVSQFKKRVGILVLIILAGHLIISAYLTLRPRSASQNLITTYYKRYLLPGPFFNERHIKISPHLYIRYKGKEERWSDLTDYGIKNFSTFVDRPWRYDKLKESDYLRHIMRLAYLKMGERPFESFKNDREFIELNNYVNGELIPPDRVDSIHMIYVFKSYSLETNRVNVDTVLNLRYNPSAIVPAQ